MESLRNEPVSFGSQPSGSNPIVVNTPAGSGGYGGGIMEAVLLSSLIGNRGFGNRGYEGTCEPSASFAFSQRAADNSSQLLANVAKSEGDIKEATNAGIHRLQIENAAHFTNLSNRLCDTEKEAIKAGYEARLESLQTKSELLANQNANTISIKDDIKNFRFDVDSKFCHLNNSINNQFCELGHKIEQGFNRIAERDLCEENKRLREKIDNIRFSEDRSSLNEIRRDVDKILCGLAKVPSTNQTPSILDGCGC